MTVLLKSNNVNAELNGSKSVRSYLPPPFFIVSRHMTSNNPCSCSRRAVYRARRPRHRRANSRNSSRRRNAIRRQRFRSCDTCWRNPTSSPHHWRPGHRRTAAPEEVPCSAHPSSLNYSPRVLWT